MRFEIKDGAVVAMDGHDAPVLYDTNDEAQARVSASAMINAGIVSSAVIYKYGEYFTTVVSYDI